MHRPPKVSTSIKRINGRDYLYRQWREGDKVKSRSLGSKDSNINNTNSEFLAKEVFDMAKGKR